jgi:AraC-like DNA-binding protein
MHARNQYFYARKKELMEKANIVHVKNMVCQRCILVVRGILDSLKVPATSVELGKITVPQRLEEGRQKQLAVELQSVGLEIIDGRINLLVEGIKQSIRDYLALGAEAHQYKLSAFVSDRSSYDFGYLSDLFSNAEGITVERYFILQRLEKVKELLAYDQLSLSDIAFETGFSSIHHLSSQFKKLTGLTPSQYKQSAEKERKVIDF